MHLLSLFSLNLPLYEHKKRPSYIKFLWLKFKFEWDLDVRIPNSVACEQYCNIIVENAGSGQFMQKFLARTHNVLYTRSQSKVSR